MLISAADKQTCCQSVPTSKHTDYMSQQVNSISPKLVHKDYVECRLL